MSSLSVALDPKSREARVLLAAGWIAAAFLTAATWLWVPWHMDEFVMFHQLACNAPSQQLDTGPLGCSAFASNLLGLEFHRSYSYIGITSSLVLWPFWALLPSLSTTWAVGVLFLLGIAVGLTRSFQIPARYSFIVLLFFPLIYNVVHDGGPVRVSLLVISWSPWLLQRAMRATRPISLVGWSALLLVGVLASVEDKAFFVYLLPGTIAFSIAALPRWHVPLAPRQFLRLCGIWGAAIVAAVLFLLVVRVDGMSYFSYLGAEKPPLGARPVQALADLVRWSYDWPMWAHRVVEYPTSSIPSAGVIALVLVMPVVLLTIGWAAGLWWWRRRRTEPWTGLFLAISLVSFGAGAIWSGGWAGHHYVFVLIPVITAIAVAWFERGLGPRFLIVAGLAFSTVLSIAAIHVSPRLPTSTPFIDAAVEEAVRSAEPSDIINCASFGCGWQDRLLNRGDLPVFMSHWNEGPNTVALEAATRRGGDIIHVCLGCGQQTVEQQYPGATVSLISELDGGWTVFRATP